MPKIIFNTVNTALKGSIRKWELIIDGQGEDISTTNCPLCKLFNTSKHKVNTNEVKLETKNPKYACVGCPIMSFSGQPYCMDTPYFDWHEHHKKEHKKRITKREKVCDFFLKSRTILCKKCGEIAKKELIFLKSIQKSIISFDVDAYRDILVNVEIYKAKKITLGELRKIFNKMPEKRLLKTIKHLEFIGVVIVTYEEINGKWTRFYSICEESKPFIRNIIRMLGRKLIV